MGIVNISALFPGDDDPESLVVTELSDGLFRIDGVPDNLVVFDETHRFLLGHPQVTNNEDGSYTVRTE